MNVSVLLEVGRGVGRKVLEEVVVGMSMEIRESGQVVIDPQTVVENNLVDACSRENSDIDPCCQDFDVVSDLSPKVLGTASRLSLVLGNMAWISCSFSSNMKVLPVVYMLQLQAPTEIFEAIV